MKQIAITSCPSTKFAVVGIVTQWFNYPAGFSWLQMSIKLIFRQAGPYGAMVFSYIHQQQPDDELYCEEVSLGAAAAGMIVTFGCSWGRGGRGSSGGGGELLLFARINIIIRTSLRKKIGSGKPNKSYYCLVISRVGGIHQSALR